MCNHLSLVVDYYVPLTIKVIARSRLLIIGPGNIGYDLLITKYNFSRTKKRKQWKVLSKNNGRDEWSEQAQVHLDLCSHVSASRTLPPSIRGAPDFSPHQAR